MERMNSTRAERFVGVLPAAGLATRLSSYNYPKELLPVLQTVDNQIATRPLISFSTDQFQLASLRDVYVVTSTLKLELCKFLGDGAQWNMKFGYFFQEIANGLAHAIALAGQWEQRRHLCVALPDTLIRPASAMDELCEIVASGGHDLMLGVFPTDRPFALGPVRIGPAGDVLEILDKPNATDLNNTWGLAILSPAFVRFLSTFLKSTPEPEPKLGDVFSLALRSTLKVGARYFANGTFDDLGTPNSLARFIINEAVRSDS
jgi:glucose-1-phosphate thymidylyltransferase